MMGMKVYNNFSRKWERQKKTFEFTDNILQSCLKIYNCVSYIELATGSIKMVLLGPSSFLFPKIDPFLLENPQTFYCCLCLAAEDLFRHLIFCPPIFLLAWVHFAVSRRREQKPIQEKARVLLERELWPLKMVWFKQIAIGKAINLLLSLVGCKKTLLFFSLPKSTLLFRGDVSKSWYEGRQEFCLSGNWAH